VRLGLYPVVLLLTLISSGAIANESLNGFSSPTFRQFEATYNASTMGMTLDLKRSLTKEGDVYTLSSRGKKRPHQYEGICGVSNLRGSNRGHPL
jgi:hypothetical protein